MQHMKTNRLDFGLSRIENEVVILFFLKFFHHVSHNITL